MSVPSSTGKIQYVLGGGVESVAVPFYFVSNSHVRVVRTRNEVDVPLTSGYSLAGAGASSGGTLTLDGTQTLYGDRLTVKRNVPLTQLVQYAPNDRFPASTHERALDLLTMMAQQTKEAAERALIYAEGELIAGGNVLPKIPTRQRKVLGFDPHGALDLTVSLEDLRTLVIANPVAGLTNVTDYGDLTDPVTNVADYGTIAV